MRLTKSLSIIFTILFCAGAQFQVYAQDRCGTVEYTHKLKALDRVRETDQQFEQWLEKKKKEARTSNTLRALTATYQIPVVVHIIHKGEPIGQGSNISTAQVLSQIKVLNADFRRENADAVNTPALFQPVAAGMDIEFVLAKRDPEGLPTNGIVRKQGSQDSWSMNDNYKLKSQSYWPSKDYLNIWVCDLADNYIGYAQFPVSNQPGLEDASNNALTDGVVIAYHTFGSIDDDDGTFSDYDPRYNKGRTTTHEVSHFLGLRHIWGDDDDVCGGPADYVADTPDQGGNSSGCPTHPRTDCSVTTMFQNFTDYTNDACMNMFTQGQVDRMTLILDNSPRRNSLLTSPGLEEPAPVANDVGVRAIASPGEMACSPEIVPQVEVRNYGSNTVTSVEVDFFIDGINTDTKTVSVNLDYLESAIVSFTPVTLGTGYTAIGFQITQTNGVADGNSDNNIINASVLVPESVNAPFSENFNTMPENWTVINADQQLTWELAAAPNASPGNLALSLNFYDYEDKQGELDFFLSPVFDLSNAPAASLSFDVAYARYQTSTDRLRVYVITNCDGILEGTLIFDAGGSALATSDPTTSVFVPDGPEDWERHTRVLTSFLGQQHVQIAFVGINDWGNRLYLDNISVKTTDVDDIALERVSSPSPVTCDATPTPRLVVKNNGTQAIKKFSVEYTVNNGPVQTKLFTGLNIEPAAEAEVALPTVSLGSTTNTLSFVLLSPNDSIDENPANNEATVDVMINGNTDRIPLRENFDTPATNKWIAVNPKDGMNWQTTATDYGTSMVFKSYDNALDGDQAWLVSPSLDFSRWATASMQFDIASAGRSGRIDSLEVYALTDCGNRYQKIYPTPPPVSSFTSWKFEPDATDWTRVSVNFDSLFYGETDVRIAFVATNRRGNNIYIDNVEFFAATNPNNVVVDEPYSVYGYDLSSDSESNLKIKFNLPEKRTVRYTLVDAMGKAVSNITWLDVLNQTFDIDITNVQATGVYMVHLVIGNRSYATRVVIRR